MNRWLNENSVSILYGILILFLLGMVGADWSSRYTESVEGVVEDIQYIALPETTIVRMSDGRVLNYLGKLSRVQMGQQNKLSLYHHGKAVFWDDTEEAN
jgi:hypothetical protein